MKLSGMRLSGVLTVLTVTALAVTTFSIDAEAARRKAGRSAAAAAAISAAWHDARVERGFVCYTDHFHYGSSGTKPTRRAAEIAAIGAWSSFVDFEYGGGWGNFSRAGSKRMTCNQGSSGWDCSVEARPCRGI